MAIEATRMSYSIIQSLQMSTVYHISCLGADKAWISNKNGDVALVDVKGKEHFRIIGARGFGIHLIGNAGELLLLEQQRNICRLMPNMKVETFITFEKGTPTCLYFSKLNGDLLVVVTTTGPNPRVIRYTIAGQKVSEFEFDKHGDALYGDPGYITENVNGDICITDFQKQALIVVDKFGNHRFTYNAPGVCTDRMGQIFLYDDESNSVLDKDGNFLSYLKMNDKSDIISFGLCIDKTESIWNCRYRK